jgi:hypothetical protein
MEHPLISLSDGQIALLLLLPYMLYYIRPIFFMTIYTRLHLLMQYISQEGTLARHESTGGCTSFFDSA